MVEVPPEQELIIWEQAVALRPNDPNAYVRRGMVQFKLGRVFESIQDFDRAEQLDNRLTPYLWQRGLSRYYLEQFAEAAQQFELDLKINPQDVEEMIWRYLSLARLQGPESARVALLPAAQESRPVLRKIYDLFNGDCTVEAVLTLGENQGDRGLFYSLLYVGLFYEATNVPDLARIYIVKAANQPPLDDYMWHLARVHKQRRRWTD